MKKLFVGFFSLLMVISTLAIAMPAHAQTSGFTCGIPGAPIINVTEKVKNDADSGTQGDTWALDAYTRTIKVWNRSGNTYCAVVTYKATFASVSGHASPGGGGTLTGDEVGKFTGGYQSSDFTGTLSVNDPSHWPLKGKVTNSSGGNVVDYMCTTDPNPSCPGYIDFTTKYFNSPAGFSLLSWGWVYTPKDARDGSWTNALSGTSGDILDVD